VIPGGTTGPNGQIGGIWSYYYYGYPYYGYSPYYTGSHNTYPYKGLP
jgi:hypothetical protein